MGKRIVIEVSGEREEEIAYETINAAVEAFRRNPLHTQFSMNQEAFTGKKTVSHNSELKVPSFLTQNRHMSQQEKAMRETIYGKKGGEDNG
ncbi:MAG: hypothetical protein ACI4A3_03460 [Lachnospiraceae bacterium]